jgi:hypothetical protein
MVTVRFTDAVRTLGTRRMHRVVERVLCHARDQRRFRVVHYEMEENHLHLIVEASSRAAMTRGMRVVNIRLGKQLNRALGRRRGQILADRYHEQPLLNPRQVRNALAYVLCNRRHHAWGDRGIRYARGWTDRFSSARFFDGWKGRPPPPPPGPDDPVAPARTLLLKRLWRRHGLIPTDHIPARG